MLEKILGTLIMLVCMSLSTSFVKETPSPIPPHNVGTNENVGTEITDETSPIIPYTECLELTNKFPHNAESFTQGLFFHDGQMYETTGRYKQSKIYKSINVENGIAANEYVFSDDIFAEGSVVFKDKLYVLTYREQQVQVFDPVTLGHITTYSYPRLGWGLTTDGNHLIAGDGTSTLYFLDENLNTVKQLTVTDGNTSFANINELEYINGEIWANQWLTNRILIIDPENGKVKRIIDFTGMFTPKSTDNDAVLNGIAYNASTDKLYITGKLWETLFEFSIK